MTARATRSPLETTSAPADEGPRERASTGARARVAWMLLLLASICFEGQGRKWAPWLPGSAFYFAKDAVLLGGLLAFGLKKDVKQTARALYGPFLPFLVLGMIWTGIEMFNPSEASIILGLIGFRSYWLWWLAPLVIASALPDVRDYKVVVVGLSIIAGVVAVMALIQYFRPTDDAINTYAAGAAASGEQMDVAIVATTGRARVSSTFSFITGFTDFATLVPPLLLTVGIGQRGKVALLAFLAAAATAAVAPTGGSRGPILVGFAMLIAVAWGAGLLRTKVGRRVLLAGILVAAAGFYALPEAVEGVQSRFTSDTDETQRRVTDALDFLPPVALLTHHYEALGLGTGMMHNSRLQFGVPVHFGDEESDAARILVEQGPVGYLIVWTARLGIAIALLRVSARFKRAGERAYRGLAMAYVIPILNGSLMADHVFAALYFAGLGLLLRAATACAPPAVKSAGVTGSKGQMGREWRRGLVGP